jgi:hypothetical protein
VLLSRNPDHKHVEPYPVQLMYLTGTVDEGYRPDELCGNVVPRADLLRRVVVGLLVLEAPSSTPSSTSPR